MFVYRDTLEEEHLIAFIKNIWKNIKVFKLGFVKTKEEYIKKLKACGFNVIAIIGLYFEKWMCGTHCIYFRKEMIKCDSRKDNVRRTSKV